MKYKLSKRNNKKSLPKHNSECVRAQAKYVT